MDEESPKPLNISNFFGVPDASGITAAPGQTAMTRTPVLSGGLDMSNLLNIIKTQINEKQAAEDIEDDSEKLRLQTLVDSLTGRVDKLTSELSGLFSLIIGDISKKEKESRSEVKLAIQERAEISKATLLKSLQQSTEEAVTATQEIRDQTVAAAESEKEMGLLAAALGIGGTGFLSGIDANKTGDDLSEYTGGEKLSNPVKAQEIYRYLLSKGVSETHAKGIVNNIQHESGFDSGAEGDHNEAGEPQSFGLFQHNMGAGRAQKMFAAVGTDWRTDWKGQIDYALTESEMRTYLNKSYASPAEASRAFTIDFENPQNAETKATERLNTIDTVDQLQSSAAEPLKPNESVASVTPDKPVEPTIAAIPAKITGREFETDPTQQQQNMIAVLPTAQQSSPAPAASVADASADASNPIFPAVNLIDPYVSATKIYNNVVA